MPAGPPTWSVLCPSALSSYVGNPLLLSVEDNTITFKECVKTRFGMFRCGFGALNDRPDIGFMDILFMDLSNSVSLRHIVD